MFCLVPYIIQLFVLYIRPQEIEPSLESISLVHLTLFFTLFGLAIDIRLRVLRWDPVPQDRFAASLFIWSLVTIGVVAPIAVLGQAIQFINSLILFFIAAHGIHTFRALEFVASAMLTVMLFLALLGVHQGLASNGCFAGDPAEGNARAVFDGRTCEKAKDCRFDGQPGFDYQCEKIGLLATYSVGGRVRYRGVLEDPNEFSLATCCALPFAFALFQRRRSWLRGVVLVVSLVAIATNTVFTQSRGGQLVFLIVIGTYAVQILGLLRGMALGSIFALPVLIVSAGGREDSDESALERLGAARTGFEMFRSSPLLGVGKGQFGEHYYLTAHNAYMLAAAELGLPGLIMFVGLIYISVKTPVAIMRYVAAHPGPDVEVVRVWSIAFIASMAGMAVGVFFLSWTYQPVMWVYLGMTGALFSATQHRHPDFHVKISAGEVASAGAVAVTILYLLYFHAVRKGA